MELTEIMDLDADLPSIDFINDFQDDLQVGTTISGSRYISFVGHSCVLNL